MNRTEDESFWKKHTDKVGVAGSIFAALCCLGFPALLSILSAVGLGFLINDAVLMPLLIVFLLLTLVGLYLGVRHHGSWAAFSIGAISAILTFVSIVIAFNKLVAAIGIAGLIVASILNVCVRARQVG
jgi:mercuric ion transport protein